MTQVILFPAPQLGDALAIIEDIEKLLLLRKGLHVSRRTFLKRYAGLRARLSLTPEYNYVRRQAFTRANGKCEKCHEAPPTDLCHKQRVALFPRLALASSNVYAGCHKCHQADHPEFKLRVSNA